MIKNKAIKLNSFKELYVKISYLVDPASSYMLVSKIKPCMSKYKQVILRNCEWLIKSVIVYLITTYYLDNRSNSRANTCAKFRLSNGKKCIYQIKNQFPAMGFLVSHNNCSDRNGFMPATNHSNFCPISFRRQDRGLPWR